jgi:hypothetical protein
MPSDNGLRVADNVLRVTYELGDKLACTDYPIDTKFRVRGAFVFLYSTNAPTAGYSVERVISIAPAFNSDSL